jgi:glycosyltransferase involved in cell wall biosynthesis
MENLTVIVPFYNEEKYLYESVQRLLAEKIFERIILVNDFSSDNSPQIAKNLSDNHKHIYFISTSENIGKGNAIREALSMVNTSHVIVHDADLEYFPEDIPEMFEISKNNTDTLVLGSRTIGDKKRITLYKTTFYAQKLYAQVFSVFNNYKLSDIASCYWLLETKHLKEMNISEKGFSIEVEVLSKSLKRGMEIIEVPISYQGRSYENGKKIRLIDGINILLKIVSFSKAVSFFDRSQTQ